MCLLANINRTVTYHHFISHINIHTHTIIDIAPVVPAHDGTILTSAKIKSYKYAHIYVVLVNPVVERDDFDYGLGSAPQGTFLLYIFTQNVHIYICRSPRDSFTTRYDHPYLIYFDRDISTHTF